MTKAKSKQKGVDPKLVKAIKDMLDEVMEKPKEGEKSPYSLTDRCKVFDRFIKIEAIRLDVQDDGEGNFFKNKGGAEDEQPE